MERLSDGAMSDGAMVRWSDGVWSDCAIVRKSDGVMERGGDIVLLKRPLPGFSDHIP